MTNSNHKQDKGIAIEEPIRRNCVTVYGIPLVPILILFALLIVLINLFLYLV